MLSFGPQRFPWSPTPNFATNAVRGDTTPTNRRWYVSTAGSNSNTGASPDASDPNHKPWLTVGKSMAVGTPVRPGDIVVLGPGILYEGANTITPTQLMASPARQTQWIGDPTNAYGFKDGSSVLLAPAPVVVTPRTSGNGQDVSIISTSTFIAGNTNSVKGVVLRNFMLEAYLGAPLITLDYACTDWFLQDMPLYGGSAISCSTGTPMAARNWTLQRCEARCDIFLNMANTTAAATADANLSILVDSCRVTGRLALLNVSASGGNLAGGVAFSGCRATSGGNACILTSAGRHSTVTPSTVEGCILDASSTGLGSINCGTSGHITGSYNRLFGPVTNYTLGTGDVQNPMPHWNYMSHLKWGLPPFRADEVYGWSPQATAGQRFSAWSNTNPDFRGRTPRPWGAGASIGDIQSLSAALDATSAITGGGVYSAKFTGAGDASMRVYVPAGSWTFSVVTKSSGYGGVAWPQLIVSAYPSVGVAQTTVSAVDASEQTLTTGTITLSVAAFLEMRFVSLSSSVSSSTWFDTLTRTAV